MGKPGCILEVDAIYLLRKMRANMPIDPHNPIISLCAQGIEKEGSAEATDMFLRAWQLASNDLERCVAAHYVARHQSTIAEKLRWDEQALRLHSKWMHRKPLPYCLRYT